ncbi:alpha/beta fold hydrolase [Maricaulis sp.]|uniref:alpha/beta fold hydrolase n=1 Tax=Maricaulis sp. TaxID=1486257 RepID=UPI00262BF501|nr:alpha/beta fold hydrolase [Maricaulis sp.]MDF1768750.1 alpha/beta fold hydrolase [Maricaulis sp.]
MRVLIALLLGVFFLVGVGVYVLTQMRQDAAGPADGGVDLAEGPGIDSPWWSEADRLVDVAGQPTRVRIEGPETAPVLILVHGFSHSLESWDAWAADLSADYRVVRMDLPGHGLTGPDPQARYSVPQTVEFVDGLMDALDIPDATLVGNSLGGLVSWRLAVAHPDRVNRLVLLAPGGYSINGVTEEPVDVPIPVRFFLTQAPEPVINAATQALFADPARMPEGMSGRVHELMRGEGVGEAMVERLEVFTLPEPSADLARIAVPTLIVWGEADRMVPPSHGPLMAATIPDARLVTYPDLGHVVHEEAPARTLADMREFLEAP